jgi:hypothetical protein
MAFSATHETELLGGFIKFKVPMCSLMTVSAIYDLEFLILDLTTSSPVQK